MEFFEAVKEELLRERDFNSSFKPWDFYETLVQHKYALLPVIMDWETRGEHMSFSSPINHSGYSGETIFVYLKELTYHYTIDLSYRDVWSGYCECKPLDEGYNEKYDCCGVGCDWSRPTVAVVRVENIANFEFNGLEKDLWAASEANDKEDTQAALIEARQKLESISLDLQCLNNQRVTLLKEVERLSALENSDSKHEVSA